MGIISFEFNNILTIEKILSVIKMRFNWKCLGGLKKSFYFNYIFMLFLKITSSEFESSLYTFLKN